MNEIKKLEQGIAAQEAQRSTLGDEVVDASLAGLTARLAKLQSSEMQEHRKQETVLFADLVGLLMSNPRRRSSPRAFQNLSLYTG